jgi:fructose-bisphosphate aldolase class II
MAYVTMRELLRDAEKGAYAVGAFNIFNYQTMRAVIEAASDALSPLIIQTSVKTVKQIGVREMMDFMRPLCTAAGIPVAIHLDHCTDLAVAKQCVDAGWSSIMMDGSHLPLDQNVEMTNQILSYIKGKGLDISVEGEVGAIVGVEDDIFVHEDSASLASPAYCAEYVSRTSVDALAPAIGTAHGLYKGIPKIEFGLFSAIRQTVGVPLVVHGGTGLGNEVFRQLIAQGASKINVSTAVKIAYLNATKEAASKYTDPLKFDAEVFAAVKQEAERFIGVFGSVGKA